MSQITRKIFSLIILVSMFFFICLEAHSETIRIGGLLDLSGRHRAEGEAIYNALQRYVRLVNENGSLGPHHLELLVSDTGGKGERLLAGASKMKEQGIVGLIGPGSKDNVILIRRFAETHKIPLILIEGDSPILTYTTIKTKWTFSTALNFNAEIKALFSVFKKRGYESVGALIEAGGAFSDLRLWIRGYAPEYGLRPDCLQGFYPNGEDFSMKIEYISNCMPDVCLLWASGRVVPLLAKASRLKIPLAISHYILTKEMLAGFHPWHLAYVAVPRIIAGQFVELSRLSPGILSFFSIWSKEEFYNLSLKEQMAVIKAWDAIKILVHAIKQSSSFSRAVVRASLEENIANYPGVIGTITFSKRDHSGLSPSSLMVLTNFAGKWKSAR